MSKRSRKKKNRYFLLLPAAVAVLILLPLVFFISKSYVFVGPGSLYVSSENPKQGDTILLKVNRQYAKASAVFDSKVIAFFRKSKYSDWSAYLGVDADMAPGKYKILVSTPDGAIEKEISVQEKDFPSRPMFTTKNYSESTVLSNIRNDANPALVSAMAESGADAYFDSAFSFPLQKVERVGLGFGEFIKGKNSVLQHFGVDLRAEPNTKVYASNSGKVALAKELANYGNTIVVDHGLGIFSLYLHLDKFLVSAGDAVENGQLIGLSGNTGYSSGPHLHFSIKNNGARIDPILFIDTSMKTSENPYLAGIRENFLKFLDSITRKR